MRIEFFFFTIVLLSGTLLNLQAQPSQSKIAFAIHGGAGVIRKQDMSPEREQAYREKLTEALRAGYKILQDGGTSLDAVEAAIKILEDSPLFNAGKGAVLNADGKAELDASIMDGKTLAAGAVAAVHRIKNPISLARAVMEKSPHVLMVGDGAERFATSQGFELVPESYFITPERLKGLERAKERERSKQEGSKQSDKKGTVGAVALDRYGNLAAGTSTGGMMNKRYGRVGDSPIIGAGTYANNATCAVSTTGWGEYFIRTVAAFDVSALIAYKGLSVSEAGKLVIEKIGQLGGDGGMIILDKHGNIAMPFNSEGMYRGYINEKGEPVVEIYR
ncbi:MAG: isoaspartyl peptidase/L-asparaginase [Chloroherpetonaceae bacterium]|nr:isoaspartyl peptidase/L-asparaginase [Chloroherpetonaceae bacterium]MCS7210196.1 isoaspartyl peptidase/L-asparaginase [Chloroherpetonaceae bacterium]MDW8020658.1 isoaspartyl peptidase/L-asparaginase [Chloroherpetonaceae bacterium]